MCLHCTGYYNIIRLPPGGKIIANLNGVQLTFGGKLLLLAPGRGEEAKTGECLTVVKIARLSCIFIGYSDGGQLKYYIPWKFLPFPPASLTVI